MITGFRDWRAWLFSAKAFLASMLALYVALAAGLERPYWAMAAVYVVAHPLSGATTSKALYRALGTAIGAMGSIILVPLLVDAPILLSAVVALWTSVFLFASLIDGTPRGYIFLLAGYSLPLIALPTVGDPSTTFDVATSRALEITIGITCASLVSVLVFPSRIGPALAVQVSQWLKDAGGWATNIITDSDSSFQSRQQLAADVKAIDGLIRQLSYDARLRETTQRARHLRGRMVLMLPLLSSLADRLSALRDRGGYPPPLQAILTNLQGWIESPATASELMHGSMQEALRSLDLAAAARGTWENLLLGSAIERLQEFVDLWQDCRTLCHGFAQGESFTPWKPVFTARETYSFARSVDFALIAMNALAVGLAIFVASAIWIETGWADGAGFVTMAAVSCCFFAGLDDPSPMIARFALSVALATALSAFYLFAILPLVDNYEGLVMVFAPLFLLAGTMATRSQFNLIAVLVAVNTASFIGLQSSYEGDFSAFLNGGIASFSGSMFGLAWSMVVRPVSVSLAARRLLVSGWRELADTGLRASDQGAFAMRMLDRLGQLVPRLAGGDGAAHDLLVDLRIGINILDLQRAITMQALPMRDTLTKPLRLVARHFSTAAEYGAKQTPSQEMLAALDEALGNVMRRHDTTPTGRLIQQALVGLRRALFADAAPPELEQRAYAEAAE